MTQIYIIALNTLRQTVRQRLFFNVAVFGVGMLLLGMVMGQLTFGMPDRVVRSIGLSGVSISLDLLALFIAVGLVHQEIDKKTLFVVLVRPVRRWQYVIGRYLGLVATLALTLIGLGAVFFGALLLSFGRPMTEDLVALAGALPEAAMLAAIGVALSTFSTPTLAGGVGLGIWIASTATDDLLRLTEKADALTKLVAQAAYYVLPNLSRLNFREHAIYKEAFSAAEVTNAILYGGLYSAAIVALASLILSRREMV